MVARSQKTRYNTGTFGMERAQGLLLTRDDLRDLFFVFRSSKDAANNITYSYSDVSL